MARQENLAQYVSRALREKNLTVAAVERRAGGEISKAYVSEISNGKITSLTVKKLQALARGLDVLEEEIFVVARGAAPGDAFGFDAGEFSRLCSKYQSLPEADRQEVRLLLEVVEREIEWRRARAGAPARPAGLEEMSGPPESDLAAAETGWREECCGM